jgi:hypothetical protein
MKTKRSIKVGTIVGAAAVAFAGLMTIGTGVSNASTLQTEGTYPSRSACLAAGPGVEATTGGNWTNYWCVPDRTAASVWRLVLSS